MSYIKLKNISNIYFALLEKSKVGDIVKTVSPMCLLEDNVIDIKEEYVKKKGNEITLQVNDIIVKRISPTYVNVLREQHEELYLFNNSLAIRIIDTSHLPTYIAYIIEQQLPRLISEANNGTNFAAINRKMLEDINIPLLSLEKQNKLSELWNLNNTKQQLLKQLIKKEYQKTKAINKQLQKKLEENKNGK